VSAFTIRFHPIAQAAEISAAEACVSQHGGSVNWQHAAAFARSYGLVEGAGVACASALKSASRAAVFGGPVIALAITPSVSQALPALHDALAGTGAPGGVLGCDREGGTLVLEWDLDRSSAALVLGIIDTELARFRAARVSELLAPLPLAWWTHIAAEGLRAPEIAPDRVLEAQLEVQHVVD
jgi:hypothetical protein